MLDPQKIRADFPIFRDGKRAGEELVYLDSAATSQRPLQVIDAVSDFYKSANSNVHRGLYPLAEEATMKYEAVRTKARSFMNAADESEVIFTKNATEAANLVMRGWGWKNIRKGDKIVVTIMEHHSNFVPWQQLAKMKGAGFEVVGMAEGGLLDMGELEKKIKGAKLIAFSAASNVVGTRTEVRKICGLAADAGAVSVVDAAQSAPSEPTDVRKFGCDFLMFSGHKMLAPFGSGVLYGRKALLEEMDPFMYGSEMIRSVSVRKSEWNDLPYKFESGTPDIGAIIGLGTAMDYLCQVGLDGIRQHEESLVAYMLDRLQEIPGLRVLGPQKTRDRCALVAFSLDGVHPHDIAGILAEDNICVRSGHHCAMPLHERLGIQASTRASVYIYNKKSEIDRLAESLRKAKKTFS